MAARPGHGLRGDWLIGCQMFVGGTGSNGVGQFAGSRLFGTLHFGARNFVARTFGTRAEIALLRMGDGRRKGVLTAAVPLCAVPALAAARAPAAPTAIIFV